MIYILLFYEFKEQQYLFDPLDPINDLYSFV